MISLQLGRFRFQRNNPSPPGRQGSLEGIQRQLSSAARELESLVERRQHTLFVPTDMLFSALPLLFPPERMLVASSSRLHGFTTLRALYDVTDDVRHSRFYVHAEPARLQTALVDFEHTGSQLGAWIHSHPGKGPEATAASQTDRVYYRKWIGDYSPELLAIIVSEDRFVRFWGDGLDSGINRLEFLGEGLIPVAGHSNVFRLAC